MFAVPSRIALSELQDDVLLARMHELAQRNREVTACTLAHLGEVDDRRLYLGLGHPSLFDYCRRGLGFSEGAAYKRMQAARACRRHPELLAAVVDGRLHLSAVGLLAPHVTEANLAEVLAEGAGRSKRDLEILVERLLKARAAANRPTPPVADRAGTTSGPALAPPSRPAPSAGQPSFDFDGSVPTYPVPEPTRPDRFEVESRPLTVQATRSFLTKLDKARALLGHSVPSGDATEILERALDVLVEKLEKARFGSPKAAAPKAAAPKAAAPKALSPKAAVPKAPTPEASESPADREHRDHIPAAKRRTIYDRDGGCCTFVGTNSQRCGSTFALEIHHIRAVMDGGTDDLDNLTLHCKPHNAFVAEQEGQSPRPTRRRPRPQPTPGQPTPAQPTPGQPRQRRATQASLFPSDRDIPATIE